MVQLARLAQTPLDDSVRPGWLGLPWMARGGVVDSSASSSLTKDRRSLHLLLYRPQINLTGSRDWMARRHWPLVVTCFSLFLVLTRGALFLLWDLCPGWLRPRMRSEHLFFWTGKISCLSFLPVDPRLSRTDRDG